MESAADGIISQCTNGVSQSSTRAVLLMKACIISLISVQRAKNSQQLSGRKAWRRHRFGLMRMLLLNPNSPAWRLAGPCTSILQSASSCCCTLPAITQRSSDGRFAIRSCSSVLRRPYCWRFAQWLRGMTGKYSSVSVIGCWISSNPLMN